MKAILIFAGATLGGTLGWLLGKPFGIMAAWLISVVGTALGVYYGRRWASEYFG